MSPNDHPSFNAVLLAAGVGRRLGQALPSPKVLLDFGGKSLLARHCEALVSAGAQKLVIVTGFETEQVHAALRRIAPPLKIELLYNPRFTEGSVVSLAASADVLRSGSPTVLMDGDVLYDPAMLVRLRDADGETALLVDRELEPGDEPVKVCFDAAGTIVDFRKKPENPGVWHGESVGFFRFSAMIGSRLADRCGWYAQNAPQMEYEEAIRDLMLAEPARFCAEDVTDLAWTEIDFEEDVVKAREVILPQLEALV